jgi:hypothetical protein
MATSRRYTESMREAMISFPAGADHAGFGLRGNDEERFPDRWDRARDWFPAFAGMTKEGSGGRERGRGPVQVWTGARLGKIPLDFGAAEAYIVG